MRRRCIDLKPLFIVLAHVLAVSSVRPLVIQICEVEFILPGQFVMPTSIMNILKPQAFYKVTDLSLAKIITPEFVSAFVKNGHMYMLSADTHPDTHDCVALTPNGKLHLNLTKDTYEKLGIQGKPSLYNTKSRKKYTITVDMTEKCFQPGRKYYDRILWCFTDRLQLKFDFLVSWVPPADTDVSSTSIGCYFDSLGCETSRCKLKYSTETYSEMAIPKISSTNPEESGDTVGYESFHEWMGAISCGISCTDGEPDSYTNTFCCPEPQNIIKSCIRCNYRGLITCQDIQTIITDIRKSLVEQQSPWAAITVHGFQDTPVTWRDHEHGFLLGGDNSYTFVCFSNADYWLYKTIASHDVVP